MPFLCIVLMTGLRNAVAAAGSFFVIVQDELILLPTQLSFQDKQQIISRSSLCSDADVSRVENSSRKCA